MTLGADLELLYVHSECSRMTLGHVPETLDQEVEKIKQKYEPLLKDPVNTIGGIGQSICDTADEKGVAYSSGYIVTEVVTALLADKGLDKIKNVAKTGKTADNVADIAEGAAEDAGKAGKTAGKVGESGSKTVKNGATRAAQYSSEWGDASLQEAIDKFAPNVEPVVTSKGKFIYNNQETGISVVYDKNGNYFRIEDTTRPRGRNYLDIDGNDMNNEVVNGKTRGRSRADYQRVTHFNNSDK